MIIYIYIDIYYNINIFCLNNFINDSTIKLFAKTKMYKNIIVPLASDSLKNTSSSEFQSVLWKDNFYDY